MPKFEVVSEYTPSGDQPEAIEALSNGIEMGLDEQDPPGGHRLGQDLHHGQDHREGPAPHPGAGPQQDAGRPAVRRVPGVFPPTTRWEYFVSYYDYYQPEAYIPHTDTFIEKDSAVNEEIDRLRLSATASLLERRDVITLR